ncbi:unnamed protein product [Paramecium sonneborni]|uniref:Uncharacterized protein n=1 Tax=Paramecium sonneborni TaxID=65129 RepID=A0A8S1JX04_9CILI|nr:unnamed protein product [Paramecium sonneborni]
MENNKLYELLRTYQFPEKKLKRLKQIKEKKHYIKKAYPLEFGPDGKTLLKRGPWTQKEREIYLQNCQEHEEECRSNKTKELFKQILEQIPTRNLTQLKGFHKKNNPFPTITIIKNKRIRRTKLQLGSQNSNKLLDIVKKNQKKKQIKQLEKLAQLNNQILTLQTQMVQFSCKEDKQIQIKIYINLDNLINTYVEEDYRQERDEIKTENLDLSIEQTKEQINQQKIQKDKIIVSLKNLIDTKVEEDESKFINKAKIITFKELLSKIEVEKKSNNQKQLSDQKFWQGIGNQQKILIKFKQQQRKEVLQIENQQDKEKDVQQIPQIQQILEEKQQQQQIQPEQTLNEQQNVSPKNKMTRIEKQKTLSFEMGIKKINDDKNSNIIVLDSPEKPKQNPNNENQFDFQQYLKKEQKDINQQIIQENKSGQNNLIFESHKDTQSDQDKNNKKDNLNQSRNDLPDINKDEKVLEESLQKEKQNEKSKQKQLSSEQKREKREKREEREERERKRDLRKQKQKEYDMQKEIDRQKEQEIELEIEKIRIRQKEIDKQQEIEKQQKLEAQKLKEKQRQQQKEKRIQAFNLQDRKERNRTKNRELRSLQELSKLQKEKKQNTQVDLIYKQKKQYDSSHEQSHHQSRQFQQKGQEVINQQQGAEIQNQQQGQNLITYNQNQYQVPIIDQMKQQQFYIQNIQGKQFVSLKDCYKLIPGVEGQYQNQQELINQNKDQNDQDKNSQFSQLLPIQMQTYPYQEQANSQPQAQVPFQPNSTYIANPYFYPQLIPISQLQQQAQVDGSQNVNKDQYQVEMMYVFQEVPQNFDPNYFFQFSPSSFVSIPGGSKLGDALK